MVVGQLQQILPGVYEITPDAGSAFFLRIDYLSLVKEDELCKGAEFDDERSEDLLRASLVFSVEKAALGYLARSEHSRFGLFQKLVKKDMDVVFINQALDYLESVGYLDDERYAGAWLRTRSINHAEGRARLFAELLNRGVDRNACKNALDDFFSDRDQTELCRQAYKKYLKIKGNTKKIVTHLMKKGFSQREIRQVLCER